MPKHPGHVDPSGKTGRTRVGGNMDVSRPINIATSNPSKIQVKAPPSGNIPQHSVTKLTGRFHTVKKG